MQTFRTPNGSVCYQKEDLPAKRQAQRPNTTQISNTGEAAGNHCHSTVHPSSQGRSSSEEDEHPVVCPPQILQWCQRTSVESLLAVYWGTTPAKAPETRWVSHVVIQTHNWWSSKKEDSDSFWWGIQQERALQKALCKNAAGAQGIQEPSMSFTWPLSTHGDWWVWYLDGSPQNERKVVFLCMCSSGYFPHGFLSPSNSQLTAQESFLPHLPQTF